MFGYSHMKFMGAIADTLTEAGHNVTLLMPIMDAELQDKKGVKLTKNIIEIPCAPRVAEMMMDKAKVLAQTWVEESSVTTKLQMARNMTESFKCQCEQNLNDEKLIEQLKREEFDVGIAEAFGICGFGIFEILGIQTSIVTFSGVYLSPISRAIGEPIVPSYVPGVSVAGDRMNVLERFLNTLDVALWDKIFTDILDAEIDVFKRKFGSHFKSHSELLAQASYVFTNSNPYLDYPRPLLHKTISIGGITVSADSKQDKLSAKWDAILNERNTTVLVSFGSVTKTVYMPGEYKSYNYLLVEKANYFVVADSRLTVFVTHAGLGSTTELAYQGKPAILIPLFAEQPRNARMLAKHGGGIVLSKNDLASPEKLRNSLLTIMNDPRYSQNAKRLSEMLINPPISPKLLLLRHCEFAARFGRLPNLDPYGRQLSFVQYFLIDIAVVAASVIAIVVFVALLLLRKCLSISAKLKIE
ncbi:unnamed protein product [Strongylus vulgaris]|uniref:glucuronosyltransferase n=1 Tax=Strongylus vulgaris TaxID=40348 RepID=A0A3P7J874_STRVU|nr:unnamed protein product [Strongylus vulgaris]